MQTQGSDSIETPEITPKRSHLLEVLAIFTRLGLTSFGGPIAHLGYFREEIVIRRKWVDERTYGDLVGLCQFLPGPASSQTGISLGIMRAGLLGGLMAWVGFTLPSAILLTLFAYWTSVLRSVIALGILHGLMVVAVAVVAQAVWGMARTHCPDRSRATIAILAVIATLLLPAGIVQVAIIATAGFVGWFLFKNSDFTTVTTSSALRSLIPRALAIASLALFTALLVLFLLPNLFYQLHALVLFASFYRSGALVFGGGHVVLPLLQAAVVLPGWVTETQFLTGYSAAQAVPGPLFTFSAYLGAIEQPSPNGWVGAIIALLGIYLPSFLLLIGILPFWNSLRNQSAFQAALRGINAAVVGLLLAALYQPVWTSTIKNGYDFLFALAAFGLLVIWKLPPWIVVILAAIVGGVLSFL